MIAKGKSGIDIVLSVVGFDIIRDAKLLNFFAAPLYCISV